MTGTVFITGVAGFLGSHIADAFLAEGWAVRGIDNLSGGQREHVDENVEFAPLDCLDRESYIAMLGGCDLVYHCASSAHDGLSVFAPAHVFANTAQATVEVASASLAAGVRRFVQCSSMARYGAISPPFDENMRPVPVTPYGIAKLAAEHVVENLFETHEAEYNIAVPHNIIGPRQRRDDPYRNVAAIMANRMLQDKQPIVYGDGSQQRCFSFIQDVVDPMVRMGTLGSVTSEVINVGPDEETTSILELATKIAGLLNFELDPVYLPMRPQEVSIALCSADKARRLLGYETETSLDDGLAQMIDSIQKLGPKPFQYDIELEIVNSTTPRTWSERLM